MSKRPLRSLACGCGVLIATVVATISGAGAITAAPQVPAGLTVSPAMQTLNLTKTPTPSSLPETITNNTNKQLVIAISAQDFTTLGSNGSLQFLTGTDSSHNLHGLSAWLKFNTPVITLSPGESRHITVTVINENTLAPGGHYAAITYSVQPDNQAARQNQVTAREIVSSLVFLTTYGNVNHSVSLGAVPWSSLQVSLSSTADLVFTNTGNVQTTPRGLVTITNFRGHEVARGIANVMSGLVLPGGSRLYAVPLRAEGHVYPGIYHLRIAYEASGPENPVLFTKTFIVITKPVIIALILVGLGATVWLARYNKPLVYRYLRQTGKKAKTD